MPSYQRILALLVFLFATAAFAPRPPSPPGNPQITCIIEDQIKPRDTYIIRGRNWNVTEAEFKDAINTDDSVLTAWEWMSAIDDEGAQVFKAKFRLPSKSVRATKKKLAKLAAKPFLNKKWRCWKPNDKSSMNEIRPSDDYDYLTGFPHVPNTGGRTGM